MTIIGGEAVLAWSECDRCYWGGIITGGRVRAGAREVRVEWEDESPTSWVNVNAVVLLDRIPPPSELAAASLVWAVFEQDVEDGVVTWRDFFPAELSDGEVAAAGSVALQWAEDGACPCG